MQLGSFSKFRAKNSNLSVLTENWHTWYLGGADSESGLRFLKFWLQNLFLGKFGPKKSTLDVLPDENWHTCYFKDADSYSNMSFLNFQPKIYFLANLGRKSQSCLFYLKIVTQNIRTMLTLIPTLIFWNFKPKSIFGQVWVKKVELSTLPGSWHTECLEDEIARIPRKVWKWR